MDSKGAPQLAMTLTQVSNLASAQGRSASSLALELLNETEPYVGAKEVAALLGNMSPLTVKQWAKAGKIPGIKPGKEWLFRLSEINSHLNVPPADPWVQSSRSRGRRRVS